MNISITNDPDAMDLDIIHGFLCESYWSPGISKEMVENAMRNSLPFGLYVNNEQVGYARIISDYTTFAYLADVFILPDYQGRGLGKYLLTAIHQHHNLQGLRRWLLATHDAHGLYKQFGWTGLDQPDYFMSFTSKKSLATKTQTI